MYAPCYINLILPYHLSKLFSKVYNGLYFVKLIFLIANRIVIENIFHIL